MIIYPAIDIRDGKCVRLIEGDFTRETVFDQDPAEAAHPTMPAAALRRFAPDFVLPVAGLRGLLHTVVR